MAKQKEIQKIAKGVYTECSPQEQPPGTKRYALNVMNSTVQGDENNTVIEMGFSFCGTLSSGFFPISEVYIGDDAFIVFSVNPQTGVSEIGITDKFCTYVPHITSSCLGFQIGHQIDSLYRLRRGCEHTVYFANGKINPLRYVNFARLPDFYTEAYANFLLTHTVEDPYEGEKWDCNKFRMVPVYKVPCITDADILTGGKNKSGTYNFSIRLVDADYNPTPWIYSSQIVNLYADSENMPYNGIRGSSNVDVDEYAGGLDTTKAIQLTLSNLDTQYPFYQIAVSMATNGTKEVNKVVISPVQNIQRTTFLFDGLLSGYTNGTVEELLVKKTDLEYAEHIEQLENRMIAAKITGKQVNWCEFQKYASKIATRYRVETVPATDQSVLGNDKNPLTPFKKEGFMGDEVYAKAIVYVFNDGFESPAFHIPGRPLNKYYNFDTNACVIVVDDAEQSWSENLTPWFENEAAYDAGVPLKKYQVLDTSVRTGGTADEDAVGAMQYHENREGVYEAKDDCNGNDYWGVDCCGNPLVNTPIRHHKFPGRGKEKLKVSGTVHTGNTGIYVTVSLKEGATFPAVPFVTLTINYENPLLTPVAVTLNIYPSTDITPGNLKVDLIGHLAAAISGDVSDFQILDETGTIVTTYAADFEYSVEVRETNSSITDDSIVRILGIEFTNIEYPHPDIVGHYFVRAERDDLNRTVLDKGIFGRVRKEATSCGTTIQAFSFFTRSNNSPDNAYVFAPRFLFNKDLMKPEYIKNECQFGIGSVFSSAEVVDDPKYKTISGREIDVIVERRSFYYGGVSNLTELNYPVSRTVIMDGVSKDFLLNTPDVTWNTSWTQKVQLVKTTRTLPYNGDNVFYASLKVNRDVHSNLDSLRYYRMHNCMLTAANTNTVHLVYGGDVFISEMVITNSTLREQKKGIGVLMWGVIIGAVLAVVAAFTGGTSIIPLVAFTAAVAGVVATGITAIVQAMEEECLDKLLEDTNLDDQGHHGRWNGEARMGNEVLMGIYVESEINMGLRQEQKHECGGFLSKEGGAAKPFFKNRWTWDKEGDGKAWRRDMPCPDIYHYNKDFSRQNLQNIYRPLPSSYTCCTDCLEDHPNRVAYTEQSFQEELTDNYKIFKPNNYRDIESEHGAITGLVRRFNKLFVFTEESCWELPQVFQERVTGDIVSFIGTGEFFSVPPRPVLDSEMGEMGTQHKWSLLKVKEGIIIVNEIESKIYLLGSASNGGYRPLELSGLGNASWFLNNLNNYLENQFLSITGFPYPFVNNPANPQGVGIHTGYDRIYGRVLITKKDYLIVEGKYSSVLSEGKITWSQEGGVFQTLINGNTVNISVDNRGFFENKSWTVSFSIEEGKECLLSWHSYIPNFYIATPNRLISTVDHQMWAHNKEGLFTNYYGQNYPHIIEFVSVDNPLTTKLWDDIMLQVTARKYDAVSKEYVDVRYTFFNKAIFYNSRQTTGEVTLTVKGTEANPQLYLFQQIKNRPGEILIDRAERDWCINDIRDYRVDYDKPVFKKDWASIKGSFPIDKVLDTTVIDFNKDWTQLESLRDKFLIVRLILDNLHNVQLVTNFSITDPQESFR